MDTKVALLVVYNHRYDKNIPVIDRLYKGLFSHVFHLVPFYDGTRENVIPVYDSSYYFQNYIAQAYTHISRMGFTHYLIVADDMILNPRINENNIWEEMGIDYTDCYISRISVLQQRPTFWAHTIKGLKYKVVQPGVEIQKILPSKEEAQRRFALHGIPTGKVPLKRVIPHSLQQFFKYVVKAIPFSLTPDYPLVGGYSDIFLVTSKEMPHFCQYCGAFAATKLFVEIAIPTSLFLTADSIKIDKDVKLKRGDIWNKAIDELEQSHNNDLNALIQDFPKEKLFLHPVKLSRWKYSET